MFNTLELLAQFTYEETESQWGWAASPRLYLHSELVLFSGYCFVSPFHSKPCKKIPNLNFILANSEQSNVLNIVFFFLPPEHKLALVELYQDELPFTIYQEEYDFINVCIYIYTHPANT